MCRDQILNAFHGWKKTCFGFIVRVKQNILSIYEVSLWTDADLWLTQEEQWLSKSHAYRLVDVDVPFSFTSPDQTAAALVNEMMKTKTERLTEELQVYSEVLSHENVRQRQRVAAQINVLFWNRKEDKNMLICMRGWELVLWLEASCKICEECAPTEMYLNTSN